MIEFTLPILARHVYQQSALLQSSPLLSPGLPKHCTSEAAPCGRAPGSSGQHLGTLRASPRPSKQNLNGT
eukprot:7357618-Pyramimonas_sp.AAC.2